MKVLLSIKPEYVEKIFSGEKKYEFRKSIFKNKSVDTIVVYSTMPVGRVVGELKIDTIIEDEIDKLWEITKKEAGISYDFFKSYFKNNQTGYAISIKNAKIYDEPLYLSDISNELKAPQSFCYIEI